jgi:hypothetical protein
METFCRGDVLCGDVLYVPPPLESTHFYSKITGEKNLGSLCLRKANGPSVRYLIRVAKNFRTQPCHTSKGAEFYVDFKNIILP